MNPQDMPQDGGESKSRKRKPHEADPWYKRYPRDFYDDTRVLKPDERGLYNDIVDLIYMAEGPLKDDDRILAHKLYVDIKLWRRVRRRLLAGGWLFITRGHLHNKRAKEVLATREEERTSMGRRGLPRPDVQGDFFKNTNEINGNCRASSTELESQRAEEEKTDNIIPLRASSTVGGLASLNGIADVMLKDIVQWMTGGDEAAARAWLAKQIAIFGQKAVCDSYGKLGTDIASGMVIARPLQTWTKIAERMRDEPAASNRSPHDRKLEKIRAFEAKAFGGSQ